MKQISLLRLGVCAWLLLAAGRAGWAADHGSNEILRTLLSQGVAVGEGQLVKLPEPALADAQPAAAQRQRIEALAEGRNSWADLTRRSIVAPFLLKTSSADLQQQGAGRRLDLWFVAYGRLDTLEGDDFLTDQFKTVSDDAADSSARLLSAADLQQRGLPGPSGAEGPRWVAAETTLLERVRVSATTCSLKTRSAESLLVASVLDSRFAGDAEFPNRWRSILRDDAGQRQLGPPHVYAGMGSYVKATRLAEPEGALLIEYHLVYAEPLEWFNGAGLLQSKLPIVAQTIVRKLRRSLAPP